MGADDFLSRCERMPLRVLSVAITLAVVVLMHWLTPTNADFLYPADLVLRKLLLLPVILAAVWFGLRGSVITAATATVLCAPLIVHQWSGLNAEKVNQLGELASIWVVALLTGLLTGGKRRVERRLLDSHRGALTALVIALDAREDAPERHSLRVAAFAERLGREMGIAHQDLEDLKLGALLHDIGKIGVRDEILLADGPLDIEAARIIRRHPEIGLRILEPLIAGQAAADVVYCHHERYNGMGYPRRLAGPQIPLVARIFSVVEAYDALTTDRSYREAMPPEKARELIEREKGKQFDPLVVDAFLRVTVDEWGKLASHATLSHRGNLGWKDLICASFRDWGWLGGIPEKM